MKVVGTKEAFKQMIGERGVYNKLGVDRSTVSTWKRTLEGIDTRNSPPSLDKMEEMLQKYGATVFKEKVWNLP